MLQDQSSSTNDENRSRCFNNKIIAAFETTYIHRIHYCGHLTSTQIPKISLILLLFPD